MATANDGHGRPSRSRPRSKVRHQRVNCLHAPQEVARAIVLRLRELAGVLFEMRRHQEQTRCPTAREGHSGHDTIVSHRGEREHYDEHLANGLRSTPMWIVDS